MTTYKIYYPDRVSEFELQAQLYYELKKNRINARGEVKAKNSRLDLVIYNEHNKAIAIIEVKSRKKIVVKKYRQVAKYKELFNLPIIICMHKEQINETIEKIKGLING
ncbi:type I restriction enzyme HsdR N-terminal domain-containing protein [Candidatus Pacearchaeota archaeon]|nr:type I restriction enzyme HsdR N-terminal domain-containing protein [Candidatus Pacearchaeota archaeon]